MGCSPYPLQLVAWYQSEMMGVVQRPTVAKMIPHLVWAGFLFWFSTSLKTNRTFLKHGRTVYIRRLEPWVGLPPGWLLTRFIRS